jgi:hypothetical protein
LLPGHTCARVALYLVMKAGLMIGRGGIAAILLRVFLVVGLVVISCPADQAPLALCVAAVRIVELLKVMRASIISGGLVDVCTSVT